MKFLPTILASLILSGCAASSSILVGTARSPISPDQVKIYLSPPKAYEEVAVLDASSKSSWAATDQGKMDVVVTRLKEEAAKLGANGVIFRGTGEQYGGSVGTANASNGFALAVSSGVFHKQGSGIAIYVKD